MLYPIKPIVALTDWQMGEFVAIEGDYGGYQDWLHTEQTAGKSISRFYANRACGVTAAANVTVYLAKHDHEKAALVRQIPFKRREFTELMKQIYQYIPPGIWGIPSLRSLARRFQKFAGSRGIELTPKYYKLSWRKQKIEEITEFIIEGLGQNRPVLLLTWNVPEADLCDLKYHWVTVTALSQKGGEYFITTSNWGEQRTYHLNKWVNMKSLYRGLLYFK
ncbi:hypothetical protein EII17_13230 [Clostridiales bacterium COT073_COT-073]|nr:hypothetical protein EII17_13230 [Clostridiales bacterium COT073_COT-073]